jgi:hypothetical protein
VVQADGGQLVRTPAGNAADHRQARTARLTLRPDGGARAEITTVYTGHQHERTQALAGMTARERTAWLHDRLSLPSFEIQAADFSAVTARTDSVALPLTLTLRSYAARTGTRLFVPLNTIERWTRTLPARDAEADGPHTQPVHLAPYPFTYTDRVTFVLPEGFQAEAMPDPVHLETPFARYEAAVTPQDDSTYLYRRTLVFERGVLPPEQYEAARAFIQGVVRADRAQAVFVQRS